MNIFVRQNNNDLLRYLNEKEYQQIHRFSHVQDFKPSEIVFQHGDKAEYIYVVKLGCLEFKIVCPNGKAVIVDEFFEGEMTGEENFVFSNRRHFTVHARTSSQTYCYPIKEIIKFLKQNPIIASKINAAINDAQFEKNIIITQALY